MQPLKSMHYWQITNTSYQFITQGKLLHCDVKVTKSAVHWFSHLSENRNPFPNTVLVKYESWCEKMYKLHLNDQDKQVWMYVLHGHNICREQKQKHVINVTMKYWTDHTVITGYWTRATTNKKMAGNTVIGLVLTGENLSCPWVQTLVTGFPPD